MLIAPQRRRRPRRRAPRRRGGGLARNGLLFVLLLLIGALVKALIPMGAAHVYAGVPRATDWFTELTTHDLVNPGFALSYSEWMAAPLWVGYIARDAAGGEALRRPQRFTIDARTLRRVAHDDFTHSGFDRGHLAPNYLISRLYGAAAQQASFRMSNILPQPPRLNQVLWQRMEELEADQLAVRHERLFVLTGPIYDRQPKRLESGIPIPSAYYRIWLREAPGGDIKVASFIVPGTVCGDEPLQDFWVPLAEIEARTGFDFFPDIDPEHAERLHHTVEARHWPLIRSAPTRARYADNFASQPCPYR